MSNARPRVVIIGAGFGGLFAAKQFKNQPFDVTLIDKQNHHLFQPLLYLVATSDLAPTDITWPIRAVFSKQKNIKVNMECVSHIDLQHNMVITNIQTHDFDYLIVATGANNFYFGNSDWEKIAPGLKTIEDALTIRNKILNAFEEAEITTDPARKKNLLTFAIVGGGPTGVEMAGAIAELSHSILLNDFRNINKNDLEIFLIEGGDRLLPTFPNNLSSYTKKSLEDLGVKVITNKLVKSISPDAVVMEDQTIASANIIWTAGINVTSIKALLSVETDRGGKAIVEADLTLKNHPNVFIVGDAAKVPWYQDKSGNTIYVPGIAPAAKQEGKYAANVIKAKHKNKSYSTFKYKHAGNLATIGRHKAVVDLGFTKMKGLLAWYFWGGIHIYFLINAHAATIILIKWFWVYLTKQKNGRLISRPKA